MTTTDREIALDIAEELLHLADGQRDDLGLLCMKAAVTIKTLVSQLKTSQNEWKTNKVE